MNWQILENMVSGCRKCKLSETRTNTVFGEGNVQADLMFVGEGPGHNEDMQGRPFVGAAGQLLERMLASICLDREDVYICNIIKCRPPGNRVPEESEAEACLPYLRAQFLLLKPKIIVCLGASAAKQLYDPKIRISRERGVWKEKMGVWFMPTYHPAALLRDVSKKEDAWHDMQAIRQKYLELCPDNYSR